MVRIAAELCKVGADGMHHALPFASPAETSIARQGKLQNLNQRQYGRRLQLLGSHATDRQNIGDDDEWHAQHAHPPVLRPSRSTF